MNPNTPNTPQSEALPEVKSLREALELIAGAPENRWHSREWMRGVAKLALALQPEGDALIENCAKVCDSLAQYWLGRASFKRGRALQDAAVRIRASAQEWATLWEKNTDYMPFPMPPRGSVAQSERTAFPGAKIAMRLKQQRDECAEALRGLVAVVESNFPMPAGVHPGSPLDKARKALADVPTYAEQLHNIYTGCGFSDAEFEAAIRAHNDGPPCSEVDR